MKYCLSQEPHQKCVVLKGSGPWTVLGGSHNNLPGDSTANSPTTYNFTKTLNVKRNIEFHPSGKIFDVSKMMFVLNICLVKL